MKNFLDKKKAAGDWKSDRKGGFKGGKKFGPRPTLYRATCDQCRSACEVPFQPTGQRPVYCRDCFVSNDKESQFKRPSFLDKKPSFNSTPRPSSSNNDEVVRQLKALNNKMDQLLEALSADEDGGDDEEEQSDTKDVRFK